MGELLVRMYPDPILYTLEVAPPSFVSFTSTSVNYRTYPREAGLVFALASMCLPSGRDAWLLPHGVSLVVLTLGKWPRRLVALQSRNGRVLLFRHFAMPLSPLRGLRIAASTVAFRAFPRLPGLEFLPLRVTFTSVRWSPTLHLATARSPSHLSSRPSS